MDAHQALLVHLQPFFQCHPISIEPKKTPGKFRVINDYSHPKLRSINNYILKEFSQNFLVSDRDIAMSISFKNRYRKHFQSNNNCYFPVEIVRDFWENSFYMDTRLSMDERSNPGIFNFLPDAVEQITKNVSEFDICVIYQKITCQKSFNLKRGGH